MIISFIPIGYSIYLFKRYLERTKNGRNDTAANRKWLVVGMNVLIITDIVYAYSLIMFLAFALGMTGLALDEV